MTKIKFAVTVNLIIVFLILHNVVSYVIKAEERVFFTAFLMALVYFIASGAYSLYHDMFEK